MELSIQEMEILARAMGNVTTEREAVQFHAFCVKKGHPLTFTTDEVFFLKEEDDENSENLWSELLGEWSNKISREANEP